MGVSRTWRAPACRTGGTASGEPRRMKLLCGQMQTPEARWTGTRHSPVAPGCSCRAAARQPTRRRSAPRRVCAGVGRLAPGGSVQRRSPRATGSEQRMTPAGWFAVCEVRFADLLANAVILARTATLWRPGRSSRAARRTARSTYRQLRRRGRARPSAARPDAVIRHRPRDPPCATACSRWRPD